MVTPFGWLASRIALERRSLRVASLTAMVAAILIIVGGGVVRVTGSGLGCPDWPACTDGSLAPTAQMGIHATIEFANRLLTTVLCAAVGWVIIAARLQREPVPGITRWAWVQFWLVVLNAMIGGVTVWVKLNPFMVAGHFLAATLLLTAAAITWDKTQNLTAKQQPESTPQLKTLGTSMLAINAVLVILGTAVTGSGPHAGDSADVPRMGFDWLGITVVHAVAAVLVVRLVWGFVGTRYARFSDFVPGPRRLAEYLTLMARGREPRQVGHNPAAAVMIVVLMALLGGVLTLVLGMWHLYRRRPERLSVPYGVAIALAGLWVIGADYLPATGAVGMLG